MDNFNDVLGNFNDVLGFLQDLGMKPIGERMLKINFHLLEKVKIR